MRKRYLDFVNDAIAEAKVTLDPLTAANFADPPRTVLYNRFKAWVNRAYKELMLSRNEWEFRMERANVTIYPRIHVIDYSGTTVFAVGDLLEGASSKAEATIVAIHTHEDVEGDTAKEYTLSVSMVEGANIYDFIPTEEIDRVTPTFNNNVASFKGAGNYNFAAELENAQEVDIDSIRFYDPTQDSHQVRMPLEVILWENWLNTDYSWASTAGMPFAVTKTFDGSLQFYPRLDRSYIAQFNYSRKYPELINWNDEALEIPEAYEDYLMWKAIADYADWDSNQRVFSRANKNLEKYTYWLERDELPDIFFGRNKFYGHY